MSKTQFSLVGNDVEVLVNVIGDDGAHAAATIDTGTTRIEGNAAVPTITTIGTGQYKIVFSGVTPAPAEGDVLTVKINGGIDGEDPWTEYSVPVFILAAEKGLSSAEAQTASEAAIITHHLDHLLSAEYDAASPPGVANSFFRKMYENNSGTPQPTAGFFTNAPSGSGGGGDATAANQSVIIAAIAALENVSQAEVQTAATAALTSYDPPTQAELTSALSGLNDLDSGQVQAAVESALDDYDPATATGVSLAISALENVSQAEVQAASLAALQSIHLDCLFSTLYDATNPPGNASAYLNVIVESNGLGTTPRATPDFLIRSQVAAEAALTGLDIPTEAEIVTYLDGNSVLVTKVDAIDSIVDSVLVDTNTTVPNLITSSTNSVLADLTTQLAATNSVLAKFAGITSLADWLALLGGDTEDTSTLAEFQARTAGAGYNNQTDSQEALRNRGDAAWTGSGGGGGGTGTGARTVTLTITNGTTPLQTALVRLTEVGGGEATFSGKTDVNGQIVFNVDDASYTVAITKPYFSYAGSTLVVDGDETETLAMSSTSIAQATRGDMEFIFGIKNIEKWADLDRDENAASIESRISTALTKATAYVKAEIVTTAYNWDDVYDHVIIVDLVATQAGLFLYANRAEPEEKDAKNPMDRHLKRLRGVITSIRGGTMALIEEEKQSRGYPFTVDDNGDVASD